MVGKALGVFAACMLVVRMGLGRLTDGTRPVHYFGVAALAGIGFTMSLFIGVLAFEDLPRGFDVPIRIGVLGGSLLAATIGILVLRATLPRTAHDA